MEKYKITNETKLIDGHILHRIKALKKIDIIESPTVKNGELGGWVENENNLSQEGNCWIYKDAIVMENARLEGTANVYDNAIVKGNSKIYGVVSIGDNVMIEGDSIISGDEIYGAKIEGEVRVNNARISGNINIRGNGWIDGSQITQSL